MSVANDVVRKCNDLARFWEPRNTKFRKWYSVIEMVDELAQANMESFVGNDPQSSFKLGLGILDQTVPHRIAPRHMSPELIPVASQVREVFETAWQDIFKRYRRRGKHWQRHLLAFMLATGWYSVFSVPSISGDRFIAEVWHPATVFQSWDEELIECAHIIPATPAELLSLKEKNGWTIDVPRSATKIYDHWWIEQGNKVFNATVVGQSALVKEPTQETRFKRIPIFTGPVGGLPDTGLLTPSGDTDRWKAELGQSWVATNENIYKSWNKWWTFSMQLLRDTAQAKIKEKARSGKPIVKQEDIYRRGASSVIIVE